MRTRIFLMISFITSFAACNDDKVGPRTYPRVLTRTATEVNDVAVLVTGEITFSSVDITDHGFVWSGFNAVPRINNTDNNISLGIKSGIGTFESNIESQFEKNKKYYVRAYAKSADHTVYGNIIEFVGP
jgi:hypothetical protein